jgi:hypothetical protein
MMSVIALYAITHHSSASRTNATAAAARAISLSRERWQTITGHTVDRSPAGAGARVPLLSGAA